MHARLVLAITVPFALSALALGFAPGHVSATVADEASNPCPAGFTYESVNALKASKNKDALLKDASSKGHFCMDLERPRRVRTADDIFTENPLCPIRYLAVRKDQFADGERAYADNPQAWAHMHGNSVSCVAAAMPGEDVGMMWSPAPRQKRRMGFAKGVTIDRRTTDLSDQYILLSQTPNSSTRACNQACVADDRCALAVYSEDTQRPGLSPMKGVDACLLYSQVKLRNIEKAHRDDYLKANPLVLVDSKPGDTVAFKKGHFSGTVDYGVMYTARELSCPSARERGMTTPPRGRMMPPAHDETAPVGCVFDKSCKSQVFDPKTGKTTRYGERKVRTSGEGRCTVYFPSPKHRP